MSNAPKTRSEEIRELYRQGIVMHADIPYLLEINADLLAALEKAKGIMWMAKEYAEGGGSGGPEICDYVDAESVMDAAIARAKGQSQ